MTWKNFQEDAYNLTKTDIRQLTNRVLQNYRDAIKYIDGLLRESYARFLTGISPENYYNEMIKRDRLENLLSQMKREYSKYSLKSERDISNLLSVSFSNTYYRKIFAANWLTEKNVFGLLPSALNELTVLGTNEAWRNIRKDLRDRFGTLSNYMPQQGTLSKLLKNNRIKELGQIQSAITQRFINGSSYTQTINQIKDAIGREFKDGNVTKYTGAKSNALRIIRTEGNRVMNSAGYAADKNLEANGIDTKRRLVAVLDNKTRAQSATMDGQTVGVDEPFRYPNGVKAMFPGTTGVAKYDINDRETVITIIEGMEPGLRIGRNPVTGENEYFSYKDFDTWAEEKGLSKNFYGEYIRK